jgi:hypothetical protein
MHYNKSGGQSVLKKWQRICMKLCVKLVGGK